MIIVQLILYCLLFSGMVRMAVRGGAVDGLYFYPKPVQERAIEIGLTTQDAVRRKRKRFMVLFYKWKPQEYLDFLKANGFTVTDSKVYGGRLALTYAEAKVRTDKKN